MQGIVNVGMMTAPSEYLQRYSMNGEVEKIANVACVDQVQRLPGTEQHIRSFQAHVALTRKLLGCELMQRKPLASFDRPVLALARVKPQNQRLHVWHRPRREITLLPAVTRATRGEPIILNAVATEPLRPDMLQRELPDRVLLSEVQSDAAQVAVTVLAVRPTLKRVALLWRCIMLLTPPRPQGVSQEAAAQ